MKWKIKLRPTFEIKLEVKLQPILRLICNIILNKNGDGNEL